MESRSSGVEKGRGDQLQQSVVSTIIVLLPFPFAALAAFLISRNRRKVFVDEFSRLEHIIKLVYNLQATLEIRLSLERLRLCFLLDSRPLEEGQD